MGDEKYYFDFGIGFPAAKAGDTIQIKFFYTLSGYTRDDFKVRTANNAFCILNALGECTSFSELWDTASVLEDTIDVKVVRPPDDFSQLCFEMQNTKTGKVYRTPVKRLWQKGEYSNYAGNITKKTQSDAYTSVVSSSKITILPEKQFTILLVLPLLVFVVCFVAYKMLKSLNART